MCRSDNLTYTYAKIFRSCFSIAFVVAMFCNCLLSIRFSRNRYLFSVIFFNFYTKKIFPIKERVHKSVSFSYFFLTIVQFAYKYCI